MANPKKKSVAAVETTAPKVTMKQIRQERHKRNVDKKQLTGSVFARLRANMTEPLTKSKFRNLVKSMREHFAKANMGPRKTMSQMECVAHLFR